MSSSAPMIIATATATASDLGKTNIEELIRLAGDNKDNIPAYISSLPAEDYGNLLNNFLGFDELIMDEIIQNRHKLLELQKDGKYIYCRNHGPPPATDPLTTPLTSTLAIMITGHGNDLDLNYRETIINALTGFEFSFPKVAALGKLELDDSDYTETTYFEVLKDLFPGRRPKELFKKVIKDYMENSVTMQMALGRSGPSAPMTSQDPDYLIAPGLTTSEIDMAIVMFIYRRLTSLIKTKKLTQLTSPRIVVPLSSVSQCDIDLINAILRKQLRANFVDLWSRVTRLSKDSLWQQYYRKLMPTYKDERNMLKKKIDKEGHIWIERELTEATYDRYYQLEPNDGEDPDYRSMKGYLLFLPTTM